MTVLAIDAGNTRIKWAQHDGRAWRAHGRAGRNASLARLSAAAGQARRCAVCNVGGPRQLARIKRALGGAPAVLVTAQAKGFGVTNCYRPPEALGADRWCALLALRRHYQSGTAVLAGTAVVVDRVGKSGAYAGGLIMPGLRGMLAALRADTGLTAPFAQLSAAALRAPHSTQAAIGAGALSAVLGAIERYARPGEPLVVTGGDGELLAQLLPQAQYAPNLIFDGLLIAAQT